MRRISSITCVLFLVVNCYGIRSLTINGSSTPVVTTADSLYIHAWFESPGAVAEAVLHMDLNGNEQLDPSDPWLYQYRLTDGGFDDEDESPNWEYSEKREPFIYTGSFFLCAEDNGVADTVFLTVNPLASEHCVYGSVTVPENQANILVCLIQVPGIGTSEFEFQYSYSTFTDSTGSYSIHVADEFANEWYHIIAMDFVGVAPGYESNDMFYDSVFVADSAENNIAMQFFSNITMICGVWKNDLGEPITGPAPVFGVNYTGEAKPRSWVRAVTDSAGTYRIHLQRARAAAQYGYFVSADLVFPEAASRFYPELMNPCARMTYGIGPSPEEMNLDLVSYRTTSTISGHVYKDGEAYDECRVKAKDSTGLVGNTYTKTYSDGRYEMWVSGVCSVYTLEIARASIPEGYSVNPRQQSALPGDTGIDIYLRGPGVEESNYQLSTGNGQLSIHPNPFTHNAVVEFGVRSWEFVDEKPSALKIYDLGGRLVRVLPFNYSTIQPFNQTTRDGVVVGERLEAGVYFVKVKGYEPVKMVKLK
jgi:hypothetical protein